ncbi:MAG: DUF169 domain-containing protein [Proteobacteria bacterium]|nr:DUF169 domain-containing protein [Pseudomonadota bacterium]
MSDIPKYQEMGSLLMDSLKLTTYPVAVRMIRKGEDFPLGTISAKTLFGAEVPACLTYTWCRRSGISFSLEASDIACKPIVLYFGLARLSDPDDLHRAWEQHGGYKCDLAADKKSREKDVCFPFGEFQGIALSPLPQTLFAPDLVMLFCSPLALSHLILAATYDGECITSHFNGMESSCKEGIIRTHRTGECQVVCPGMGDRVLAGAQDHEMIFSIPEHRLENILDCLFKAGNKIQPPPFGMPHSTPTLGAGKILGMPAEPGVWPLLRTKLQEE